MLVETSLLDRPMVCMIPIQHGGDIGQDERTRGEEAVGQSIACFFVRKLALSALFGKLDQEFAKPIEAGSVQLPNKARGCYCL